MSKLDYLPIIIGVVIAAIFIPITIIVYHDGTAKNDYYINDIKKQISNQSCSQLNASRSIYDPSNQNVWIKSDTLIDKIYKEKCQ